MEICLTYQRLRELLLPDTGLWLWQQQRGRVKAGERAGDYRKDGYHRIRIDNIKYLGHRLAWLYMTGSWPPEEIDHIDRNPSNNRWSNLRLATRAQNRVNSRVRKHSTTGIKGVRKRWKSTWEAYLGGAAGYKHLGTFATAEEAQAAYLKAARERHGCFA